MWILGYLVMAFFTIVALAVASAAKSRRNKRLERAEELLAHKRLRPAERLYRLAIAETEVGVEQEQAYYGLGQTLEQLDRVDDAIAIYRSYLNAYERTGRGSRRWMSAVNERLRELRAEVEARRRGIDAVAVIEPEPLKARPARAIPVARVPTAERVLVKKKPQIRIQESTGERESPRIRLVESSIEGFEAMEAALDAAPPSEAAAQAQRVVGRYLVGEKLGEGGFGAVYQGFLPVAIKLAKDPALVENLKRLAALQGKIDSPRIVAPIEVNLESDPPYLVMEHIDGPNMRDLLRAYEEVPPMQALGLIREVALALRDAHAAGVLHLDLKPENVLLTRDGQIKLTDFELGRDEEASEKLKASLASIDESKLQGTIAYMSPEQRRGQKPDARSDLYTLGVMMFEALTRELPEPGDKLSEWVVGLPGVVDRIFERCYTRYDRRYASVDEFLSDLETAINILPGEPNLPVLIRGLPQASAQQSPETESPDEPITETETSAPEPAIAEAPAGEPEAKPPEPEAPRRPALDDVIARRAREAREREAPARAPIDEAVKKKQAEEAEAAREPAKPQVKARPRAMEAEG